MSEKTDRPFEQALAELEQTVRALEDGQLGLDEALARYESGVALVKECHGRLQQAELRIQVLIQVEDDKPLLQPFKHEATVKPARQRNGTKG